MDFGKISYFNRVNFELPETSAETVTRNRRILDGERRVLHVYTGCPIWAEKQWLGKVYPLGAKPHDLLGLYARQFGAIELNVTHYRIPTPEAVIEWREQTPSEFRFCPKFPQEISHHRELRDCGPLTQMFCDSLAHFGDRLGTSFLQLPPGFELMQLPILRQFLKTLPQGFPICVEFRHPSWFQKNALVSNARDVLEEMQAGTVITDTAGRRDVVHQSLTASRVLVRFVGNELDPSDYSRIDAWIPRIRGWIEQGLAELYWIMHQPDNVLAPELVSYFIKQLNATGLTVVKVWTRKDQGIQMSLL